jgi:Ssp1 endopeptidase immunity protein Rap1a
MRIIILCLTAICASPTLAAQPTTTSATSIGVKTAGDLATACTVTPKTKTDFARLNFCNGFAQGVLQTNQRNDIGTKICLTNPAPKRSDTMKEYATWVRADPSRRVELASVSFLKFMGGRFPCNQ